MNLKEFAEKLDPVTDEVRIHASLFQKLVKNVPTELQEQPIRPSLVDTLPLRGLCWSKEEFVSLAQYHLEQALQRSSPPITELATIAAERAINMIDLDRVFNENLAEKIDRVIYLAVKSLVEELKEAPWQLES